MKKKQYLQQKKEWYKNRSENIPKFPQFKITDVAQSVKIFALGREIK